ncbi:MAG: N-acetyltransferase family protein [Desulforhopalus sp.]
MVYPDDITHLDSSGNPLWLAAPSLDSTKVIFSRWHRLSLVGRTAAEQQLNLWQAGSMDDEFLLFHREGRQMSIKNFDRLFHHQRIAVIGSNEDNITTCYHLVKHRVCQDFRSFVYPATHTMNRLLGVTSCCTARDLDQRADLQQVATDVGNSPAAPENSGERGIQELAILTPNCSCRQINTSLIYRRVQSTTELLDIAEKIVKQGMAKGLGLTILFGSSTVAIDSKIVLQHGQENYGFNLNYTVQVVTSEPMRTVKTPLFLCLFAENQVVEKIMVVPLAEILGRFSYLIIDSPRIDQTDLNPRPLIKDDCVVRHGTTSLDRNSPNETSPKDDNICPPRPSRRPYPVNFVRDVPLKNGFPIRIRPIRGTDESALRRFFKTLSADSVYFRFGQRRIKVLHNLLHRLCQVDFDRDLAFLAVVGGEQETVIGDARLNRIADTDSAELSFLVADQWQGKGVGDLLMEFCIEVARETGLRTLFMEVMKSNERMMRFGWKYNFTPYQCSEESDMEELRLKLDHTPFPAVFFARKWRDVVTGAKEPTVDRSPAIALANKPIPVLAGRATVAA